MGYASGVPYYGVAGFRIGFNGTDATAEILTGKDELAPYIGGAGINGGGPGLGAMLPTPVFERFSVPAAGFAIDPPRPGLLSGHCAITRA